MSATRPPLPAAILDAGVLAIVRGDHDPDDLVRVADALVDAGITAVEITANSRDALAGLAALRAHGGLAVGAGTILTRQDGERFLAAGAEFLVMPHVDADLIGWAAGQGFPTLPGAFTATESLQAWRAGASAVKLFPAALAPAPELGPAHLAALRGPLSDIPFVPTGGVSDVNAEAFVAAGAVALAAGTWLVPAHVREFSVDRVVQRGGALVAAVAAGRAAATTTPDFDPRPVQEIR